MICKRKIKLLSYGEDTRCVDTRTYILQYEMKEWILVEPHVLERGLLTYLIYIHKYLLV